ncbi:hypothetical protein LCGC14_1275790, partial [marine sediment metagenome]
PEQRREFAMIGVAARLAKYPKLSDEALQANRKRQRELLRREALAAYGNKCQCCGETDHRFLSIDHINGGGNQHKKITHGNTCRWLRRNNFPSGFQVLCYNCNCAKGIFGHCPHKKIGEQ